MTKAEIIKSLEEVYKLSKMDKAEFIALENKESKELGYDHELTEKDYWPYMVGVLAGTIEYILKKESR